MSTQIQITRLNEARDRIRAKLVALGLSTTTDKLDKLATDIENVANNGAVSVNVKEGETYTIPKGYHNGSGTVSGVAGGGNYTLQSKSVIPTKKQQNITPDEGSYGLSDVTVEAIPENYQDVSSVTAVAEDVLATKLIVLPDGTLTAGTMANNGSIKKTLDTQTKSFTIPKGYHDGTGAVSVNVEEAKTVTPTESAQTISPEAGKVLSSVVVNPVPAEYIVTSDADALAENILFGKTAYVDGVKVTGTMTHNGAQVETLDIEHPSIGISKGYHNGEGTVSIRVESKEATPTKASQEIIPTEGKVLDKVTVNPIPNNFVDSTSATALAENILSGKTAYIGDGEGNGVEVTGSMSNNGNIEETIDGLTVTSYNIPQGYTDGGTVSLTNDIELALAAI